MREIGAFEAKNKFGTLLDWVEQGEEIVITRNGRPVARLSRVASPEPKRRFGTLVGFATVNEDFDAPLSIDDLDFTRR